MTNFIEEFYYGNLDPQARSTKDNKTVQKQMEVFALVSWQAAVSDWPVWMPQR